MTTELAAPPVLSTPDDHILEVPGPAAAETKSTSSDHALRTTYEIARSVSEIRKGGWSSIALQFPDHMLVDAPRVAEILGKDLEAAGASPAGKEEEVSPTKKKETRICVLADTSYSACCVDEIAAEHTDADVVIHYGRTCLSPTSRLPVIFVYTQHELDHDAVASEFEKEFADKNAKVVIVADLTYQDHVKGILEKLRDERGYKKLVATEVIRDPGATIPNRRLTGESLDAEALKNYALFHISDPPASLLLALHNRFASLHVLSTTSSSSPTLDNPTMQTAGQLRRRFAKVLSLAAAGVIGILVNTLSVSNYLSSVDLLRDKIAEAGKKSYTIVVGKLNPAKLANFAEIEGWVVIGCWESGLVEDDGSYWRPVVTPLEMEVALMSEEERIWGGEWWGGIEKLRIDEDGSKADVAGTTEGQETDKELDEGPSAELDQDVDEDESLPPEFDLRTGKLVSHSRPMRLSTRTSDAQDSLRNGDAQDAGGSGANKTPSGALVKRNAAGELASINGVVSPGAEYLRSKRTWQGLGSDFATERANETSAVVEEGRSGIARGYTVGEEGEERH